MYGGIPGIPSRRNSSPRRTGRFRHRGKSERCQIREPDDPFPTVEPPRTAVDGAALLDDVMDFLGRYCSAAALRGRSHHTLALTIPGPSRHYRGLHHLGMSQVLSANVVKTTLLEISREGQAPREKNRQHNGRRPVSDYRQAPSGYALGRGGCTTQDGRVGGTEAS